MKISCHLSVLQETESGLSESEEYKLATELLKTVQLEDQADNNNKSDGVMNN